MKKPDPHSREVERLLALESYDVLDTQAEDAFDDIVQLAAHICGTPIALVSLVDEGRQWFKARVGLAAPETPRDVAFCAHAIHRPEVMVVEDARDDERFHDNPLVTGDPNVVFYAGAPLVTDDGLPLGTLCVIDEKPHRLDGKQRLALAALSRQVMRLLEARARNLELADAHRALALSEAHFRVLTEVAEEGVALVQHGRVIDCNTALEQILGRQRSELIGMEPSQVVVPTESTRVARKIREGEQGSYDTWIRRPNGTQLPVRVTARQLDEQTRVTLIRDRTEEEQLDRLKDQLISTISHELRTPLTSIRGALGLVDGGAAGELTERAAQMVRIAKRNSDRLARLVDQILDAERLRSGHLSIDMAPHRPVALVEEAVEDLGQASRLEIDDTLPAEARVHVDGDRIVQVLTNLLANAFKHGPDDAPVTVRLRPGEDDAVRFEIIDRGPGIPLEDRARLFQRFTQLDATDARAKGGSGLGLAISKALVDAHDGEVGVACPPDGGCVFWFELPSV